MVGGDGLAPEASGTCVEELWYVVKLGAPMTLSAIFGYLPTVVMLVMVRTVAEPGVTGGAGMGVMYQNLVGVSTIIGVGSGLGPLCAQAFGAGEHGRVGDLLQRQLVIHGALLVPVGLLFLCAEPLLRALGQPEVTAALAGRYCLRRLPALPALAVVDSVRQYAVAQRVVWVPLVVSAWSCVSAIVGLSWAVPYLGFDGAPVAL